MANNLFQPQVASVDTAVTPQQGVADTATVDLFADVAATATEAAFSFTGQNELASLQKQFGNIVQAREAGGNATTLQSKARIALDKTRASTPWVATQAEKLYKDTFGSGSGGGVFKATPEEQAKADYEEKLMQYKLERNLPSLEVAAQQISLEENAKAAKIQADNQKNVREYNGDVVLHSNQLQVSNLSVKFLDGLTKLMEDGGGTLQNDVVRNLNMTIEQEANRLEQEFLSQTRDSKTGHVLIDNGSFNAGLQQIADWKAYASGLVTNNTMTKVLTDLKGELTAKNKLVVSNKLPTITAIYDTLGSTGVSEFIRISEMGETVAKNLIANKATAPLFAMDDSMFEMPGSFTTSAINGVSKVIVPTPGVTKLSQAEALAGGTVLNDPTKFNFVKMMLEDSAAGGETVPATKSMLAQNPDSAAMYWSEKAKAFHNNNPAKAKKSLKVGLEGLKQSFDMASASGGQFPTGFKMSRFANPRAQGLLTVSGEGITGDHAPAVRGVNKIFTVYPEFLKQFGTDNGNPDMTAEEATEIYLTGKEPVVDVDKLNATMPKEAEPTADRLRRISKDIDAKALADFKAALSDEDLEELFGEVRQAPTAPESQSESTSQVSEATPLPEEATLSKEALQIQQFKEKGFTKEQVLATLEGLGFAKNMLNDRMVNIIEEVYNGS